MHCETSKFSSPQSSSWSLYTCFFRSRISIGGRKVARLKASGSRQPNWRDCRGPLRGHWCLASERRRVMSRAGTLARRPPLLYSVGAFSVRAFTRWQPSPDKLLRVGNGPDKPFDSIAKPRPQCPGSGLLRFADSQSVLAAL